MNIPGLLAAGILSLIPAQSLACSCSLVVAELSPEGEKQEWLESLAAGSDIVVLALVTTVAPREVIEGDGRESAVLEVREIFKGQPPPAISVRTGRCQNFVLRTNEERVFFIGPEGQVHGCSDYRHVMNNEEVATRLRGSANLTPIETTAIGYASVRDVCGECGRARVLDVRPLKSPCLSDGHQGILGVVRIKSRDL